MSQFIRDKAVSTEAQQKKALAYLFKQDSTGLATDGVLAGLAVTQTATASGSVLVSAGSGVVQDTVGNGASQPVSDTQETVDVFTANPMGGTPRNDIIVFDAATITAGSGGVRVIIGTPNAVPTDPTVPATAIPLARLRHAASATTIPAAKIDDLRVFTSLLGGPSPKVSAGKVGKRIHWGSYVSGSPDASGYVTITHGAGFTPTVVVITSQTLALQFLADTFTATTFRARIINSDGTVGVNAQTFSAFLGE